MTEAITTQKILDYAISLEKQAVNLYTDLASKAHNSATKMVFLEYAEEEMGHRKKLEEVADGEHIISTQKAVMDLKISDYTVNVELGDEPTYQDILLFAMNQEKIAFRLYTDLSNRVDEPKLKALFLGLAQEEATHKLRFEIEYDQHVLTEN